MKALSFGEQMILHKAVINGFCPLFLQHLCVELRKLWVADGLYVSGNIHAHSKAVAANSASTQEQRIKLATEANCELTALGAFYWRSINAQLDRHMKCTESANENDIETVLVLAEMILNPIINQ